MANINIHNAESMHLSTKLSTTDNGEDYVVTKLTVTTMVGEKIGVEEIAIFSNDGMSYMPLNLVGS